MRKLRRWSTRRADGLWRSSMLPVAAVLLLAGSGAQAEGVSAVIETELGAIEISFEVEKAPKTVANFLRYIEAGLFDGASFYRTVRADNQPQSPVKIAVIQGGLGDEREDEAFSAIRMESTSETGLRHLDGTISMARLGPDTAQGEFFICIGAQPELDFGGKRNQDGFGFAAFGRVVEGMDVVHAIHRSKANAQTLEPAIAIRRARILP